MTNREIYSVALSLIGLSTTANDSNDLEDRTPYLLASFCCSAKDIDASLRASDGLEAQSSFSSVYLSLDDDFPLCDKLSNPAALYVAAMLMIDEDSELSDSLYDKYCDAMSGFSVGTAGSSDSCIDGDDGSYAVCEPIVDRYFFC